MNLQRIAIRVLNLLAPIVGAVWIIGGLFFVLSSFVSGANRPLYLIVGVLVLIAGCAMLTAKKVTPTDIEKIQRVKEKFIDRR